MQIVILQKSFFFPLEIVSLHGKKKWDSFSGMSLCIRIYLQQSTQVHVSLSNYE